MDYPQQPWVTQHDYLPRLNLSSLSSSASSSSTLSPTSPNHTYPPPQPDQWHPHQHPAHPHQQHQPQQAHQHQQQQQQAGQEAPPRKKRSFSEYTPMDIYDDHDIFHPTATSPIDGGSGSSGEADTKPDLPFLGKPPAPNNFVTKLYQMINDPKSGQFIAWTELGTSFVVSSVGEFSRSILGSHFKHNNFSSFVRQLNMYGFHKINRTPRAQRTSTDAQTWEFSHHKFLRGRPDLLEEIKRKALEPDPGAVRHRIELPAEVAAQLARMAQEHRSVVDALAAERHKVDRLASLVKMLYDAMAAHFPGQVPIPFPAELLDADHNPPIFVTSPADPPAFYALAPHAPPSGGSAGLSPSSSPTSADFPPTQPPVPSSGQAPGPGGAPTTNGGGNTTPTSQQAPSSSPNATGPGGGATGYGSPQNVHLAQRMHRLSFDPPASPQQHHPPPSLTVQPVRYEAALVTPLPPSPGLDIDAAHAAAAAAAAQGHHGPHSPQQHSPQQHLPPHLLDGSGSASSVAHNPRIKRQRTSSSTALHPHAAMHSPAHYAPAGPQQQQAPPQPPQPGAGGGGSGYTEEAARRGLARARSESAPLGYALGGQPWLHAAMHSSMVRPRSGSAMVLHVPHELSVGESVAVGGGNTSVAALGKGEER